MNCSRAITLLAVATAAVFESLAAKSGAALYETVTDPKGPWVIHVVRVPRNAPALRLESVHASGRSLGLETIAAQTKQASGGVPIAAINADFYERAGVYAGDPRGLQIVRGELISAPNGGPSFWIDAVGQPHLAETRGTLEISCANVKHAAGLNAFRENNAVILYTPALGPSTRTTGGRELLLLRKGNELWLPLRPSREYRAVVHEVREAGDSAVPQNGMVLSIGPAATFPRLKPGEELGISTRFEPPLRGVRDAIGGGPVLVKSGRRLKIKAPDEDSYEFSTMMERHPRSGIGWNEDFYFFVAVDGRHKGVSAGMTLDEFGARLVQLGCQEALNLDGGGSSTLWFDGKPRNYLCDGYEREVANALVVVKKGQAP